MWGRAQTKIEVDTIATSPELKKMSRMLHGDINQVRSRACAHTP